MAGHWYELKSSKRPYYSPRKMEGLKEIEKPEPDYGAHPPEVQAAPESKPEEVVEAASKGEKKDSKKK